MLGAAVWGLDFRAGALPGLIVTLVLGTACFTTIGIGITQFIPNAEAGPVVVNLAVLPLTFISNIWFPIDSLPQALKTIAGIFPIKALASSLQYVFDPRYHGAGLDGADLKVLAIWTVVGVVADDALPAQADGRRGVTSGRVAGCPGPLVRGRWGGRAAAGGGPSGRSGAARVLGMCIWLAFIVAPIVDAVTNTGSPSEHWLAIGGGRGVLGRLRVAGDDVVARSGLAGGRSSSRR